MLKHVCSLTYICTAFLKASTLKGPLLPLFQYLYKKYLVLPFVATYLLPALLFSPLVSAL